MRFVLSLSLSFSRAIPHFIRTDVLLACVRECVKNMHARATQTHSCCFCFDRCLCARHTDTHYTAATHNRVILFPSSPCLPNQSIATVFTLHSIWPALSSFFFRLRNANLPHSWTLFAVQTTGDSLTLAHSLGISNQPNDLLPRIHRVSAVSGDDDDDFVLSFALCFPSRASDTGSLDENR